MDVKKTGKITTSINDSLIIAGAWAIVWCMVIYGLVDEVGIGYTILNMPLSFLAYLLGDAFRRYTVPDAFLSKVAMDTFTKKLFWAIGPQVIAMTLASVCLYSLMYE